MLKATTRKHMSFGIVPTYVGRVHVIENDEKIYSHSTGIHRIFKEDALLDAVWLMNDLNQDVKPIYRQKMTV